MKATSEGKSTMEKTRASNQLARHVQPQPATKKKGGAFMTDRGAKTVQPAVLRTSSNVEDGSNTTKYEVNGGLTRRIRIYNKYFYVDYESYNQIDELLAEFLSKATRGKSKAPGKDGKTRKFWRCVLCGQDDFSSKWGLNHHRFRKGCPALEGKTTYPYPDMESGQGKTGEMFRKGKTVQFTQVVIARKETTKGGKITSKSKGSCSKNTELDTSSIQSEDASEDTSSTDNEYKDEGSNQDPIRKCVLNIDDNPQFRVSWTEPLAKKARFNIRPGIEVGQANDTLLMDQTIAKKEDFAEHKDIQLLWITGEGLPPPIQNHPDLEGTEVGRLERLQRDKVEHERMAQCKADYMHVTFQPPIAPPEFQTTNLYQLLDMKTDFLPWAILEHGGKDFEWRWFKFQKTKDFEKKMSVVTLWWFGKAWHDPKLTKDVKASVSNAINELNEAIISNNSNTSLLRSVENTGLYIDYCKKYQEWEQACKLFKDSRNKARLEVLQESRDEWAKISAERTEAIKWDWCPIWWVLKSQPEMRGKMPPQPWRHDEDEAKEVRKVIIMNRVQRLKPNTLVYVFRMLYCNLYGKFRLISCPQWGLKEDTLPECCQDSMSLQRAVSALISCGDYLFADLGGIGNAIVNGLYNLNLDEQVWSAGGASVRAVHEWIKTVQIRALQDIAVKDEHQFVRIWCTIAFEAWGDQSKSWSRTLRIRENIDIGWICDEVAQEWSTNAWKVREELQRGIRKLHNLIVEEDVAWWRGHRNRDAGLVGHIQVPPNTDDDIS